MLSRSYTLFLGMLLIVMAIAGYLVPNILGLEAMGAAVPTVWLIVGLVSLGLGLFARSITTLRWFSGIIGALFIIWGLFGMFAISPDTGLDLGNLIGFMHVALGALGVSFALAPAQWISERASYAHE